jgi:quercetin dioxygenase-like cupin family protein
MAPLQPTPSKAALDEFSGIRLEKEQVMSMQVTADRPTRKVSWLGTDYTITVDRHDSAGSVGLFEATVPAGEGPPIQKQQKEDVVIHVLAGEYEFWLDGATRRLRPGGSVFLPRNVPHTFRIVSSTPGRNITVLTPGGFESFFVDVAARDLRIPSDLGQLAELGERYGIEFLGAPQWSA